MIHNKAVVNERKKLKPIEEEFKCPFCEFDLYDKKQFTEHIANRKGGSICPKITHECPYCHIIFQNLHEFTEHIKNSKGSFCPTKAVKVESDTDKEMFKIVKVETLSNKDDYEHVETDPEIVEIDTTPEKKSTRGSICPTKADKVDSGTDHEMFKIVNVQTVPETFEPQETSHESLEQLRCSLCITNNFFSKSSLMEHTKMVHQVQEKCFSETHLLCSQNFTFIF